jgi:hypothetical protein
VKRTGFFSKFPVLSLGLVGAIVIPLVQWLITKEITAGAAIGALVILLTSGVGTTQVTPMAKVDAVVKEKVENKVVAGMLKVAEALDGLDAGRTGEVTGPAKDKVVQVATTVLETTPNRARELTDSILGPRRGR